ncbi:RluA family pseudouridine synthase [Lentilactobacillus laojiaonis]|uniref:RluA family pseudouridine synthase n=1 Tax=Lentilactobacillus laojiaonis TaxID=2883998 RepID=UPI001D0B408B|nr:RluA family pseudouridine synthase [Lentilactobacillus laojiaonis]UDM32720.1 RluA family pseudouridine synthase [Lentilactobacillus laojiaonis]
METKKIVVDQAGERLDKFISIVNEEISRSQAKTLIENQNILVNGKTVKPKYEIKVDDVIEINLPEPEILELVGEDIPLDIVYEDDDVIVVNKEQGMVVHPAAGHKNHTLVNALMFHSPLSKINGELRPGIVHRIDKDTSGLLMVAKNDNAHKDLSEQLKNKTNIRRYYALVHGVIKENSGTVNAPLGRSPKDRKKQAVVAGGRNAVTHFKVVERFEKYTLIECQLETGRTHQIRVHMKYINHPVVGDPLYGPNKTIKGNGQFLHARELGFTHPTSKQLMDFTVPLPKIFKDTLASIRNNS